MSSTLNQPMSAPPELPSSESPSREESRESSPMPKSVGADVSLLTDHFPEWLKISRGAVVIVAVTAFVFCHFARLPLWHTDLWGHLSYGQYILTRGFPVTEPFMPLAKGMPFVDTAWLSQLAMLGVAKALGGAGLEGLQGLLAALSTLGIMLTVSSLTRRTGVAIAAAGLFYLLANVEMTVLRPQMFGLVLFTLASCLWFREITGRLSRLERRLNWVLTPALYAVWANMHGSFVIGLAVPAALGLGRFVDLSFRRGLSTRSLRNALGDPRVQRLAGLTVLAAASTLLNPYGPRLWAEVLLFGKNPNLDALSEWQPLQMRMLPGQLMFVSAAIAIFVLYRSPRRVSTGESILLLTFAAAACWSLRFEVWWAAIVSIITTRHLGAILTGWNGPAPASQRAGKWTIIAAGLIWIAFGLSPLGMLTLHARQPSPEQLFSSMTPINAVKYLREKPPVGQVFNLYEWGDYLGWAGPPGVKLFTNSFAHNVPEVVWRDYLSILGMNYGWQELLDRYSVNTVLIDTQNHTPMIKRLKEDPKWRLDFEDGRSAVFTRIAPIDR